MPATTTASARPLRRVCRNSGCAAGPRCAPRGGVLSRADRNRYRRSLRPCLATPIAPLRRAPFRQTLLGRRHTSSAVPATVIVGAQWGDEGKGKIVDLLAQDSDL